ncbi:hypothetical protein F4824DRAFT_448031 [Ustulina deusta]|nr:hypothetical protein F4824DRAFT_448031 [Ustulina deusta]
MPDKETNVPQASCDFAGEAHNHELSNEPCLSPMIGGAEKRPRIEDDNTAAEPSSAKKVRLLRELEGLKKREEELNNEDELRDLEREVEAAHKRIQDREIKTVLKIARDTSPGQKEQLQSSLSEGTLSMTNAHSGTESNRPLSVVPQTAAGHSTGHTEAHPRNSITIMDSEIPAGNSNYPTRETMSTPSLDKLDRLEYYKEVDENKSRLLQGMDIPELRRLAASEPDSLQDLEQATSIIHVYYSLFLKAGAMKDLERAIQLANEQMPSNADSPDYTPHLKDLIVMLVKKYQCTNSLSALQEAIFRAQEMVVATPPSHSNHVTRVRDFITMMLMKFGRTGSQDDLDEATIIAREVGATVSIDDSDGRGRVIKVGIPV